MKKDNTPAQDGDKREWEEEFEKLFTGILVARHPDGDDVSLRSGIVNFIRSLLSRTAERTLAEAREVVLGMKKDNDNAFMSIVLSSEDIIRNKMCDDIARALTKKK